MGTRKRSIANRVGPGPCTLNLRPPKDKRALYGNEGKENRCKTVHFLASVHDSQMETNRICVTVCRRSKLRLTLSVV